MYYPTVEIWEKRRKWIDSELESAEVGGHIMSDHPVALFYDMCISYCAGAWVSVVIMSVSVIDAHFRENEAMDNAIGTAKLLDDYYEGEDINWLRKLRNSYVHLNINNPTLDLSMIDSDRIELEKNATKAFKMTIKALFQNPWI